MASFLEKWQTNRAALFDWLVMFISFCLGFAFPKFGKFFATQEFYSIMLASLLLYLAGIVLKDLPLSHRLSYTTPYLQPVPYLIFMMVGHWIILLFLFVLAEPAIRSVTGMPPYVQGQSPNGPFLFSSVLISIAGTWMVFRNKSTRRFKRKYREQYLSIQEILADILLIAGVSLISAVFWEKGIMVMLTNVKAHSIGTIIFLFLLLSGLFLLFYLPLRYLFWLEDRKSGRHRKRLFFIFGVLLIKSLFGILSI